MAGSKRHVLEYGLGEELILGVLHQQRDLARSRHLEARAPLHGVHAMKEHGAIRGLPQIRELERQRRLSSPGSAQDRNDLSRIHGERPGAGVL
jgi:hypothetical protein